MRQSLEAAQMSAGPRRERTTTFDAPCRTCLNAGTCVSARWRRRLPLSPRITPGFFHFLIFRDL